MARLGLSEILEKTSQQATQAEQGEFLRRNWNPTMGLVVRYAYDPSLEWDLPEGTPPYVENKFLGQESNLYGEMRRMYIFMKGTGDHVSQSKKETNFVQLLENLSKEDAALVAAMKDGVLPFGITPEFIRAELPGLLPDDTRPAAPHAEETAHKAEDALHEMEAAEAGDVMPSFSEGDFHEGTDEAAGDEVLDAADQAAEPAAEVEAPKRRGRGPAKPKRGRPTAKKAVAKKA